MARAEVFSALSTALTNLGQPYFDFSFSDEVASRQLRLQQRRLAVYDFELYMEGYTPPLTTSTLPDAALSNDNSPGSEEQNDMALIIGIIVAVLVILIIVIVLVVVCRRKKPKRSKVGPISDEDATGATKQGMPAQQRKRREPIATHALSDVSYLKDNARVALPTLQSSAEWNEHTDVATAEESLSRQQSRRRIGASRGRRRGRRAADLVDEEDETLPSEKRLDTKHGHATRREKKRAPHFARQASKVIEDTKVQGAVLFVDEDSEGEEEGAARKPRDRARSRRKMPWEDARDDTTAAESSIVTAKDPKMVQTKANRELLHPDPLKSVGGDVVFADKDSEDEKVNSPLASPALTTAVPEMRKLLHSTTLRKVSGSTMFNDEDSEDESDPETSLEASQIPDSTARISVGRTGTMRADSPTAHGTLASIRTIKSSGHAVVNAQQNLGELSDMVYVPKAREPFGSTSAKGQVTSSAKPMDFEEGKHSHSHTAKERQDMRDEDFEIVSSEDRASVTATRHHARRSQAFTSDTPSGDAQPVSLVERGTRQVKQAQANIATDSSATHKKAGPSNRERRERTGRPTHSIFEDVGDDEIPAKFVPSANDITPRGNHHSRRILETDSQMSKIGMENFLPSRDQHPEVASVDADKEAVVQVVVHKRKTVDSTAATQRRSRHAKQTETHPPVAHQAEPDTVYVAPSAQGEALASKVNRKKRIIRRRKQDKADSDEDELDVEHTVSTSSRFRRHRSPKPDVDAAVASDVSPAEDGTGDEPSTVAKERFGDKMVASAW